MKKKKAMPPETLSPMERREEQLDELRRRLDEIPALEEALEEKRAAQHVATKAVQAALEKLNATQDRIDRLIFLERERAPDGARWSKRRVTEDRLTEIGR